MTTNQKTNTQANNPFENYQEKPIDHSTLFHKHTKTKPHTFHLTVFTQMKKDTIKIGDHHNLNLWKGKINLFPLLTQLNNIRDPNYKYLLCNGHCNACETITEFSEITFTENKNKKKTIKKALVKHHL